jgi:hypothetical protein
MVRSQIRSELLAQELPSESFLFRRCARWRTQSADSILVALVTIHAVIDIPADVRVTEIGRVPAPVATRALENRVVARIRVAGRAHTVSVPVGHWEPGMVERCPCPCRCIVASRAGGRENSGRRFMNWIRGGVVVGQVATVTGRRKRGVVVIYVAKGAGYGGMKSGQRERGGAVVKLSVGPQRGVMAELAGRGETYLDVVDRRGCRVVIVQVAGYAGRVGAGQIVVVVDVAISAGAWRNGVRVG